MNALTRVLAAFPFLLSPEDAMRRAGFIASATSFRSIRTIIRSFLATMDLWGGEVLQPKRIVPVYLPAWFVDGHIGIRAVWETLPGEEEKSRPMEFMLERSYVGSNLRSQSSHSVNAQIHVR